MNLEQAMTLRHGSIVLVDETVYDHSIDAPVTRKMRCDFWKVIGQHVIVIAYGNLYLALTPEEITSP